MSLAWTEIKRAKLRFGLLTGAVALLVFLIMFMQTLSGTLLDLFIGGVENQSAQVLVYGEDARRSIEGSIITPDQVAAVAEVEGVGASAPLGENTFTAQPAEGELKDVTLFGYELGGPGEPTTLSDGRLPTADGEAVASSNSGTGFAIGDVVTLLPGEYEIEIVGLATNAAFNVQPTLYTSFASYEEALRLQNPDATAILPTLVAVEPATDVDPVELATRITEEVDGVEALDLDTAVASLPGVASITQSFSIVLALAFFVIVLVTGFFFLILTVQKIQALTLLRAVGASTGYLLRALLVQVVLVTVAGVVVAGALLAVVASGSSEDFRFEADPALILGVGSAVLVLAMVASLASVRRVARLDPAAATQRMAGGGLA